jgi:hypothetical protein
MHPSCASTLLPRAPSQTPLKPQQRTTDLVANGGVPLLVVMVCGCHGRGGGVVVVLAATAAGEETSGLYAASSHAHAHTAASPAMGAGGGGWDGGRVVAGVAAREETASDTMVGPGGGCGDGAAAGEVMHFGGWCCDWLSSV